MSASVTIGGEDRSIADFSAFKALLAMSEATAAQDVFDQVLTAGAAFKRRYEAEHFVTMDRAEARRQFAPRPLLEEVPIEHDGKILADDGVPLLRRVPMLRDGEPVMGLDPLGHLSDADWEASGNVLKVPDSPSRDLIVTAQVEAGFRLGRPQALRLLALALASNADLEKWDGEGGDEKIRAELDAEAKRLLHRASAGELMRAAGVVVDLLREQLSDPFEELRATFARMRRSGSRGDETAAREPEPMRVETSGESESQPTSSTSSQGDTDGSPESSSTAPAIASSSVSETA